MKYPTPKDPSLKSCAYPGCTNKRTVLVGTFCSKTCAGRFAAKKRHGTLNKPNQSKRDKLIYTRYQTATSTYKQNTPSWANMDSVKEFYIKAVDMTLSGADKYEVDHIIPINGTNVCGLHVENNLQILTESDNIRKLNHFNDFK